MNLPPVVSADEWRVTREALLVKEKEATRARDALAAERRRLPRVHIDKDYVFDGPEGKAALLDLFEGRGQLLLYHFMFGPNQEAGCDGCSMFVDQIGHLAHLHARDTSFALVSRAPMAKIEAYRSRMGWTIPWYSSFESEFNVDFGLAVTEEQAEQMPEVKAMIDNPPVWLEEWSQQVGAELKDGLREVPSWIAFAREDGTVYHTYTVTAPDPFVAPYFSFLLERTPKAPPEEPRTWRKDEYPD